MLQKLADNGQAILCTIHQPSTQIFQTFDRLLLLKEGKSLYFGEIGPASRIVIDYFEDNGAKKCEPDQNPAEWLLEITGSVADSEVSQSWAEIWTGSTQRQAIRRKLQAISETESLTDYPRESSRADTWTYAASTSQQLRLVTFRIFQEYWRNPSYIWAKLTLCVGAVSLALLLFIMHV